MVAPLVWTKEPPKDAGWYWQRITPDVVVVMEHPTVMMHPTPPTVRIVWIDWCKTDDSVSRFLAVRGYVAAQGIGGGCSDYGRTVEWAGPIHEPVENGTFVAVTGTM